MASNFFILENGPMASPGACLICGYSGSDRLFTDPRKDFDEYGSVILCELCVGAMADDYGYARPAQVQSLETRIEEAEAELKILREAVLHLENFNDAISSLGSLRDAVIDGSVGVPSNAGSTDVVEESVVSNESDVDAILAGEFTLSEFVSVQGPDDVSDDSESDGIVSIKL